MCDNRRKSARIANGRSRWKTAMDRVENSYSAFSKGDEIANECERKATEEGRDEQHTFSSKLIIAEDPLMLSSAALEMICSGESQNELEDDIRPIKLEALDIPDSEQDTLPPENVLGVKRKFCEDKTSENGSKDDSTTEHSNVLCVASLEKKRREDPTGLASNLYILDWRSLRAEEVSVVEKKFSTDQAEYIEGEWKNGRLITVQSCQFTFKNAANETVYIKVHGKEALFTCDVDNFVARATINHVEEVCFIDDSFTTVKKNFLQCLRIIKIFEDRKLEERNAVYNRFRRCLRGRGLKTAESLECASDLLQLCMIQKNWKLTKERSLASTTQILNHIHSNICISAEVKDAAMQLLNAERALQKRNEHFPDIDDTVEGYAGYLCQELEKIYDEGVEQHTKTLLNECTSYNSGLPAMMSDLNKLSDEQALYLSSKDIQLFHSLDATTSQQESATNVQYEPFLLEFLKDLWAVFYRKVVGKNDHCSLRVLAPLTNPAYLYLYKSFLELLVEIARSGIPAQDLFIRDGEEWALEDIIVLPSTCDLNRSVLQQLRLIFKLMKHFQPGYDTCGKKFKYDFKVKDVSFEAENLLNIPENCIIWLYVLDDAIARTQRDALQRVKSFYIDFLSKGYITYIERNNDRYESMRIMVRNIISFVTKISPFLSRIDLESKHDESILEKQMKYIRDMMLDEQDDELSESFASLIDIFNEYWKYRESIIENICQKFPYKRFKSRMEELSQQLRKTVDIALSKKVEPDTLVNFFRSFNEFLKHFEAIDFEWLIKDDQVTNELIIDEIVKIVKADTVTYKVLKPKEFIKQCNRNLTPVPHHYPIKILEDLLRTVNERGQEPEEQNEDTCLNEISDLLIVIGNSFIHFKDQSTYVDFNLFLNDSTEPFRNVIRDNSCYQEFKNRLDNIENFHLYTRKQNEIGIEKALDLYASEAESIENSGFDGSFNRSILAECYGRYLNEFNNHIETANMQDTIDGLIAKQKQLQLKDNLQIDEWTLEFKRETLPSLLAGLSAVWSLQRSKDVTTTGKSFKPHCVQVLCILKLLGVDQQSCLENHLAQVLTGQGKSLVLGLLSALLSLIGFRVQVLCYSEYLANRDQHDFDESFKEFSELEIGDKVTYGTFSRMADKFLVPQGSSENESLRILLEKMILDKLEDQTDRSKGKTTDSTNKSSDAKEEMMGKENTILLIDEVDVFFSDNYYGNTYDPIVTVKMAILADIQCKIWLLVADSSRMESVLRKINKFIDTIVRDGQAEELIKLLSTTGSFFKEHLVAMINCAINVKEGSDEKWYIEQYKINDDGIISVRCYSGLYSTSTYNSYYNVFNYFRLKKKDYDHKVYANYGYLNIHCGTIAYAKLPNEYPVILGVSGTLTTLNASEKEAIKSYDIDKVSIMPSFFGRHKLDFDEHEHFLVEPLEENWLSTIFDRANSIIRLGRAVLVFFHSEVEVKKFKARFQRDINRLHIVTGNERESRLERYINEAGVAQTVTLAIRGMGRGIDFKSSDSSVEEKGGLHVIQTFFALDEKEEIQIKGRTARKDNKGSYELILCEEHLEKIGCPKDFHGSYENLSIMRKNLAEKKGRNNAKLIQESEKKHNLTMKFLNSFSNYTPDKRSQYFLKYPFVKPKAK